MITVVHFRSESGDHYLDAFPGDVDTDSEDFWNKVRDIFEEEADYLSVVDTLLLSKEDFE